MANITIVGSGMMGSALAFPARENGHEVRVVGTHLDKEIIDECLKNNKHPKFDRPFPEGVKFYQFEDLEEALLMQANYKSSFRSGARTVLFKNYSIAI